MLRMSSSSSSASASAPAVPIPSGGATSIEHYLDLVRHLSGNVAFKELTSFVAKSVNVLARCPDAVLTNAMDTMDSRQHTIGIIGVLFGLLRRSRSVPDTDFFSSASPGGVYSITCGFVSEANAEQVRIAGELFSETFRLFAEEVIDRRERQMLAIAPIATACRKLAYTPGTLTSLHAEVCRALLAARCLSGSSPLVREFVREAEFSEISEEASAADAKHILLYFYYGGMILAALKDYSRALYFLEACITVPSMAVSHIMLEAYKKHQLVFLICSGHKSRELLSLPKYASPVVQKYLRQLCPGYSELVTAYYSNKREELRSVAEKYAEVFAADQNSGLVEQVLQSQLRTSVKRLTKTFVTLSLSELAQRVGLGEDAGAAEAERLVVRMIGAGEIHARVSQRDGMVRFMSNPEQFDSVKVLADLERRVADCMSLDNKIQSLDEKITVNPNYIKKAASSASAGSSAAAVAQAQAMGGGLAIKDDMETDSAPQSTFRSLGTASSSSVGGGGGAMNGGVPMPSSSSAGGSGSGGGGGPAANGGVGGSGSFNL